MLPIDTEYAGFSFRSRLEARWAVFLDVYGVEYRYEPEGFVLPWRLNPEWAPSKRFQYLPDFHLPTLDLWGEVKGSWTAHERVKTLNGAAALSAAGTDVLLLPDVFRQPRGGSNRPWRLHLREGALWARAWPPMPGDAPELVAHEHDPSVLPASVDLLRGYRAGLPAPPDYQHAARAAQRARFEFGQTPGRPTL